MWTSPKRYVHVEETSCRGNVRWGKHPVGEMTRWWNVLSWKRPVNNIINTNSAQITGGWKGYPPIAVVSPRLFVFLASPRGTIFVPDTAGAHVSLTSRSTSTSHVTHLMLILNRYATEVVYFGSKYRFPLACQYGMPTTRSPVQVCCWSCRHTWFVYANS